MQKLFTKKSPGIKFQNDSIRSRLVESGLVDECEETIPLFNTLAKEWSSQIEVPDPPRAIPIAKMGDCPKFIV